MSLETNDGPEDDATALHAAVREGDVIKIECLITAQGVDVDAKIKGRGGPLFTAETCGRIKSMRALIELGADVDAVNESLVTPLMSASSYGRWRMVELLLQAGANFDFVRLSDNATPLKFCSHTKMGYKCAELLIVAGADPNFPSHDSQSALMIAARKNRPELLEILLKAGADPEQRCELPWALGWTALDHAINEKRTKAREILQRVTVSLPKASPGMVP